MSSVRRLGEASDGHEAEVISAGVLEIRPSEHLVSARGRVLTLSLKELQVLAALARRQGRLVTREELYAIVWGTPLRAHDRSVDVYVYKLRSKLAAALPDWRFIHTHFGLGYRLQPEPSHHVHSDGDRPVTGGGRLPCEPRRRYRQRRKVNED